MNEDVLSTGFVRGTRQFGSNSFCAVEAAQPDAVCAVHSSLCRDTGQDFPDNVRAQLKAQTGPDRLVGDGRTNPVHRPTEDLRIWNVRGESEELSVIWETVGASSEEKCESK
jgi:hypothetical protein